MTDKAPTLGEVESAGDTARAVLAEMEKGGEPPATTETGGTLETGDRLETDAPDSRSAGERARDERGRFVAAEGSKGEVRSFDTPKAVVEPPEPTEGAPEEEPLEPLAEWPADVHATFRKLPRDAQQFVLNSVNDARTKAEEAQTGAGPYKALDELLAPRRQQFARDGLDDVGAVRQLFALSDWAARDPGDFIQWFMASRGIGPEQLFPVGQTQAQDFADPALQQLWQHNNALQQKLDSVLGYIQNQQSSVEAQSRQQLETEIQRFGSAADDKGRLLHPYFAQVKRGMAAMLGSGIADNLQNAYDMACRADPEVSRKIDVARETERQREDAKRQRDKAAAARQAGSSISGTPAGRAEPQLTGDIREDMKRMAAERGLLPG